MKVLLILITSSILLGCYYGINSETSQIASMAPTCLDSLAWNKICDEHSIKNIKDSNLISRVKDVQNHFIKPKYILYFDEEPKEIIGCNWYSIRVVYNEKIANQLLTGLSPLLSNKEQKRIRNRVFKELIKYQCKKGQQQLIKQMEEPVPFAESHKAFPIKEIHGNEEALLEE